jgi:hypothetical protein
MTTKFRKKAIEVEAIQFTGENGRKVAAWASALSGNCSLHYHDMNTGQTREKATFDLLTTSGRISLVTSDWIARHPENGFSAFRDGQFQGLFEPAAAKPSAHAIKTKIIGDLEWQEEVPDREFTWAQAKEYAASLGDGWRLPTIKELLTLVDYEKSQPACSVFPDCPIDWFWSSSAVSGDATDAWLVDFYYGYTANGGVGNTARVRCVRDVKGVE